MEIMRDLSDVEVTFMDGEIKTYRINAGTSVGGYLAKEAGQTGILSLFNENEGYAIPIVNVRTWVIRAVTVAQFNAEKVKK